MDIKKRAEELKACNLYPTDIINILSLEYVRNRRETDINDLSYLKNELFSVAVDFINELNISNEEKDAFIKSITDPLYPVFLSHKFSELYNKHKQ